MFLNADTTLLFVKEVNMTDKMAWECFYSWNVINSGKGQREPVIICISQKQKRYTHEYSLRFSAANS